MHHEALLEKLLLSLFSPEELRRWLRHNLSAEMLDQLPSREVAPAEFVYQAVLAMQRRGVIDERFFHTLVTERPGRIADIQLVKRWWMGLPKHFLLPHVAHKTAFPDACICIRLASSFDRVMRTDIDAVLFDVTAYNSPIQIIDILFLEYLKERFSPLSYGREWVLAHGPRVLVPWGWLVSIHHTEVPFEAPRAWLSKWSLAHLGMLPGEQLEIVDLRGQDLRNHTYGIACSSGDVHSLVVENGKLRYLMARSSLLLDTTPASVEPDRFNYTEVYFTEWSELGLPKKGAWIQTRSPEESELAEWRHRFGLGGLGGHK